MLRKLLIHILGGFTRDDVFEARAQAEEEANRKLLEYKAIMEENKRMALYESEQKKSLSALYNKSLADRKALRRERDFYETKAMAHESDVINMKQWLNKRGM